MRLERRLRIWLLVFILSFLVAPRRQVAATTDLPAVAALDSVGLTVSDIDRSVDFFSKILSFETMSEIEVYGSQHGWCVPDMPLSNGAPIYNKADAEKAWVKLLALYKTALA